MLLPLNLRVEDQLCTIIGGGTVAARKAETLLQYGANVRAVAPEFDVAPVWKSDRVERREARYAPEHLDGSRLVIAATNDDLVNAAVATDARRRGILQQRVDAPEASDFSLPAVLRRGRLSVAFATDGIVPALAVRLRDEAHDRYDDSLGQLCEMIARWKKDERFRRLPSPERQRRLRGASGDEILEVLRRGESAEAERLVRERLTGEGPAGPTPTAGADPA